MAKSWEETIKHELYRTADKVGKERWKQQYFDEVVIPQLDPKEVEQSRVEFYNYARSLEKPSPKEKPSSEKFEPVSLSNQSLEEEYVLGKEMRKREEEKKRRYMMSGAVSSNIAEDPVTSAVTFGAFGAGKAMKGGKTLGQAIKFGLKEAFSDLTFGAPDLTKIIHRGLVKTIYDASKTGGGGLAKKFTSEYGAHQIIAPSSMAEIAEKTFQDILQIAKVDSPEVYRMLMANPQEVRKQIIKQAVELENRASKTLRQSPQGADLLKTSLMEQEQTLSGVLGAGDTQRILTGGRPNLPSEDIYRMQSRQGLLDVSEKLAKEQKLFGEEPVKMISKATTPEVTIPKVTKDYEFLQKMQTAKKDIPETTYYEILKGRKSNEITNSKERKEILETIEALKKPVNSPQEIRTVIDKTIGEAKTPEEIRVLHEGVINKLRRGGFQSGRKAISDTPSGRKIADVMTKTFDDAERLAGDKVANFYQNIETLTKAEKTNLVKVLDGRGKPISENVIRAAAEERGRLDGIVKMIEDLPEGSKLLVLNPKVRKWKIGGERGKWEILDESGKMIEEFEKKADAVSALRGHLHKPFLSRENYFPRVLEEGIFTNKTKELADHLLKTGQIAKAGASGKKLSDSERRRVAIDMLNSYARRNRERRFGNLQIAREFDLPEWAYETDIEVILPHYYTRATKRILEAKNFGSKDQKIYKTLMDKALEEGADTAQIKRLIDRALGKEITNDVAQSLIAGATGFNVVTKMGFSAISQTTQRLSALYRTNGRSFAKAIFHKHANKKEARDFFIRSGSGLRDVANQARAQLQGYALGKGKLSDIPEEFLKYTGFTKQDIQSRYVASLSGRFYVEHLAKKLVKNPSNKFARRRLEGLNVDPDAILSRGLTKDDLLKGAQKAEIDTNFRGRVLDLPEFMTSPSGRLVTQFQSFMYQQTGMLRDHVVKEALKGNPMPMVYLLTVGQVGGEAVNQIRAKITNRERPEGMKRILENYAATGCIGIFETMYSTIRYSDAIGGATAGTIQAAIKAGKSIAAGDDIEKVVYNLTSLVPLVGQYIRPLVKPKKSEFDIKDLKGGFDIK